jgi:outer membrane protein OmpU
MTFKKSLVLTTALSAVGALAATSAIAAGKPKLKISGYQETFFAMNLDRVAGQTGTGTPTMNGGGDGSLTILQYGEIRFKVKGKTDNGLKWGVRFESVAGNDAATNGKKVASDEAHMWVQGSWGRLEIGGQDGAADRVRESTKNDITIDQRFAAVVADTRGTRLRGAEDYGSINDSSDDTKLTYWTPRVSGFRGAYSYVPSAGARGSVGTNAGSFHEGSVSYKTKVNGGKLRVALRGTIEDAAAPDGSDVEAWSVGASYAIKGFKVSTEYLDTGERRAGTAGDEGSAWDIGVSYSQGPWKVGIAYWDAQHEVSGASDDEYQQILIHGAYSLGGGLTISAGLISFDNDDSTAANATDGEVAVVKLLAKF